MASGGHHGYSFMPAGMYRHLVKIAGDNKLSIKELEIMFVRDWCYRTGFKCEHPHDRVAFAKTDKKPYCKECWSRLEKKQEETVREGSRLVKRTYFTALETLVDRLNIEAKFKDDLEAKKQQEQFLKELR